MTNTRFPKLLTMGWRDAERYEPGPNDVCISIHDSGDSPARVSSRFRAVLTLEFDDLRFTNDEEADRAYIEQLIEERHAIEFTDEMADQAVAFVREHMDADRLVVHCAAGISRSVSLAQGLAMAFTREFWAPPWHRFSVALDIPPGDYVHYRLVYRKTLAAARRAGVSEGSKEG